jgi:hypothetical protein
MISNTDNDIKYPVMRMAVEYCKPQNFRKPNIFASSVANAKIIGTKISPIPQYMGLKSLRYHYWCPFNHESEGISSPRSNLSYFLGTTCRGATRMHCNTKDGVNCQDWTRFTDPQWWHSSYGQVGSPSNPDLGRKCQSAFRTFMKDHRTWPSQM